MSWIWVLKLIPAVKFLGLILILLALYFWGFKPLFTAACMFCIAVPLPFVVRWVTILFALWTRRELSNEFLTLVTVLACVVGLAISLIVGFFLARGMNISFGKACLLAYIPVLLLGAFLQARSKMNVLKDKQMAQVNAIMSDFNHDSAIYNRFRELQSGNVESNKSADPNDPFLLAWAVNRQDWKTFDTLIRIGVDVSPVLSDLVRMANTDRLQQALRAGANVNAQNGYGNTALHVACSYGKTEALPILIEAGADVNITNLDGESALWLAVGQGNVAAVEQLLRAGARTDVSNRQGKTLFAYAQEKGNAAVLQSLQKAGSNSL